MTPSHALREHLRRHERSYSDTDDGELARAQIAFAQQELLILCQDLLEAHRQSPDVVTARQLALFEQLEWRLNHP